MSEIIRPSRRVFLGGLGTALITAPAIVRVGSLMPVKQVILPDGKIIRYLGYDIIYQARDMPANAFDLRPGSLNYVVGELVAIGKRHYRCTDVFE